MHRAVCVLDDTLSEAQQFIKDNINWKISDHDLKEFILGKLMFANLKVATQPVVAFNENTLNVEYTNSKNNLTTIRREGWFTVTINIIIDKNAIELSWSHKLGAPPSDEQQAKITAIELVNNATFEMVQQTMLGGEQNFKNMLIAKLEQVNKKEHSEGKSSDSSFRAQVKKNTLQFAQKSPLAQIHACQLKSDGSKTIFQFEDVFANKSVIAPNSIIKFEPAFFTDMHSIKSAINVAIDTDKNPHLIAPSNWFYHLQTEQKS